MTVHAGSDHSYATNVDHPEKPGAYCFPPIAACITGAARLMLALLETAVSDVGGTWVFCDTDSLAIAATDRGGELIPCAGGGSATLEDVEVLPTLSYDQVEQIRRRFDTLNPYDKSLVSDVLKVEETGTCYAISAKRYAIYEHTPDPAQPRILKRSEHGLGRYLDPRDPDQRYDGRRRSHRMDR